MIEDAGLALGSAKHYYLKRVPRWFGYFTEGVALRG
jgi:hypothetical protein